MRLVDLDEVVPYIPHEVISWQLHMWQSQVEIEHYSVVYFDHVTVFEAL